MSVFFSKAHHLSFLSDEYIDISLLKNEPLIVPSRKAHIDRIRKWFKNKNIEPNIICEMDNYLDAAALAGRNVGVSIFPKTSYVINSSINSKYIKDIDTSIQYYFVWRKGHQLSVIEENFIDYIKNLYS